MNTNKQKHQGFIYLHFQDIPKNYNNLDWPATKRTSPK